MKEPVGHCDVAVWYQRCVHPYGWRRHPLLRRFAGLAVNSLQTVPKREQLSNLTFPSPSLRLKSNNCNFGTMATATDDKATPQQLQVSKVSTLEPTPGNDPEHWAAQTGTYPTVNEVKRKRPKNGSSHSDWGRHDALCRRWKHLATCREVDNIFERSHGYARLGMHVLAEATLAAELLYNNMCVCSISSVSMSKRHVK